jgi:hypothetical protein
MLLAAMGDYFVRNHTWNKSEGFVRSVEKQLEKLKAGGVTIGSYRPQERD